MSIRISVSNGWKEIQRRIWFSVCRPSQLDFVVSPLSRRHYSGNDVVASKSSRTPSATPMSGSPLSFSEGHHDGETTVLLQAAAGFIGCSRGAAERRAPREPSCRYRWEHLDERDVRRKRDVGQLLVRDWRRNRPVGPGEPHEWIDVRDVRSAAGHRHVAGSLAG